MSIKALIPSVMVISFLSLLMSIKALIPSVVVISFLSLLMSIKALIPSVVVISPESPDEYKSTDTFSGGYKFPESPDDD